MNEKSNQEFRNASGRIPYHMTNDYLFRAVLQSNKIGRASCRERVCLYV